MSFTSTNKIILGNCLELLHNTQMFPDDVFDGIITSPPYFQQRHYNDVGMGFEKNSTDYLGKLLTLFEQCVRVTKPTGSIVFNLGDKYIDGSLALLPYRFAIEVIDRFQVQLVNMITWLKTNPAPRQDQRKLINATEPFFIFAKTKDYCFNMDDYMITEKPPEKVGENVGASYFTMIAQSSLNDAEKRAAEKALTAAVQEAKDGEITGLRMKIRGMHALAYGGLDGGRNNQITNNGFTIIKLRGKTMKRDVIESSVETIKGNKHPAVFPQTVIEELIRLLTPVGGIVFDPFNGSGTTSLAAINTGRWFSGIEIDPDYHALGNQRIAYQDNPIFGFASEIQPKVAVSSVSPADFTLQPLVEYHSSGNSG